MTRMWVALGIAPALFALFSAELRGNQYTAAPALNLQKAFGTRRPWSVVVTAQSGDRDESPEAPPSQAKICFVTGAGGAQQCSYFKDLFHSTLTYEQLQNLSVACLASRPANAKGLLLKAVGIYPTGTVNQMAIWVYSSKEDSFRLVSALQATEERIFTDGALAGFLVTANWQWEQGETRFGDDHRRKITAYRYLNDDGVGAYRQVLEYITARKYNPEDSNTIESEIPVIAAKLAQTLLGMNRAGLIDIEVDRRSVFPR